MAQLLHVQGVNDEVLDALLIGGLLYLGYRLAQHAVPGPQGPPGPVGPPATQLAPPPGGHLDPMTPPRPTPRPVSTSTSGVYHTPAPLGQRDYYAGGPATSPPQGWNHLGQMAAKGAAAGATTAPVGAGFSAAAGAAAGVYTPPPAPPFPGPGTAEHAANRAAVAAQSRPKSTVGHVVGKTIAPTEAKPAARQTPVAY